LNPSNNLLSRALMIMMTMMVMMVIFTTIDVILYTFFITL